MIYFPGAQLWDGAAEFASGGFSDGDNEPAWDTWVWLCSRRDEHWQPVPVNGWHYTLGDPTHSDCDEYLVAWVPPASLKIAERGIQVNPEACIVWASASLT